MARVKHDDRFEQRVLRRVPDSPQYHSEERHKESPREDERREEGGEKDGDQDNRRPDSIKLRGRTTPAGDPGVN